MSGRVARRGRRSKAAAVSRARQHAQQRAVRARLEQVFSQAVQQVFEQALVDELDALLGRGKYARRRTAALQATGARCSRCQLDWAPRFARAGSYRRTLLTAVAAVTIRVPRLGGVCGGTVPLAFATVGRYQRSWGDLQERARQLAGLCLSLRDVQEILALESGQPVARSTLNRWVHEAAALAELLQQGPLGRVPAVVLLDGLWVKLMEATGETYRDKQQRQRRRVRRVKVPLLVAYGVDPQTGERWILDWELGTEEDAASWQRLLERLQARGLRAEAGFTLFVHDGSSGLEAALGEVAFGPGVLRQRCVFHVLKNVRDHVRGEPGMSREAKRARRREVLQAAAPIGTATDRATVQRRWRAFRDQWAAREPEAVAALARSYAATLAYLAALERGRERGEEWQARYLRTTSALERANRALRQKVRQVGMFHAQRGLTAAVALVIAHRGLSLESAAVDHWTDVVEAVLHAA